MLTVVWVSVGVFVTLITSYICGGVCADIAKGKGYDWQRTFFLCFFLGITGFYLVAAKQDRVLHAKIDYIESSGILE